MSIIQLENVGKKFILSHKKDGLLEHFLPNISAQKTNEEFWALKNINMEIGKGKIIGIMGRNGAGKTTLLNILTGITTPTEGKVKISGRVSSLLTVGAGFQEELSGKENIYLNGAILGMSNREIERKYKNIVEFSELDGFLDVPVNTYSQGMRMRLGFSIAAHVDFDILLIDEIIGVGDASFQKKSYERIVDFKRENKTMVITTQNLDVIERLSDKVYLLENGRIEAEGSSDYVVERYLKLLSEKKFSKVSQL